MPGHKIEALVVHLTAHNKMFFFKENSSAFLRISPNMSFCQPWTSLVFELEEGHFWYPNLDLDLTHFKKQNYRTTLHSMLHFANFL